MSNLGYIDFSVVVTIYGGTDKEHLKDCLESIYKQKLSPNEIVLVIDGCIPCNLREFLINFVKGSKIEILLIESEVNVGPGAARNLGIRASNFEYVAIMDSDDICHPDRFYEQILFLLDNPHVDVLGGEITEFNSKNFDINLLAEINSASRFIYYNHDEIYRNRLSCVPCNNVTVIFKKSKVLDSGGYPELRFGEDLVLWHQLLKDGCFFSNLPSILVYVRTPYDFASRRTGLHIFLNEIKYLKCLRERKLVGLKYFFAKIVMSFFVRFSPRLVYLFLRKIKNQR